MKTITYSRVNYINHVVHYTLITCLPYTWKFVHFDYIHPLISYSVI